MARQEYDFSFKPQLSMSDIVQSLQRKPVLEAELRSAADRRRESRLEAVRQLSNDVSKIVGGYVERAKERQVRDASNVLASLQGASAEEKATPEFKQKEFKAMSNIVGPKELAKQMVEQKYSAKALETPKPLSPADQAFNKAMQEVGGDPIKALAKVRKDTGATGAYSEEALALRAGEEDRRKETLRGNLIDRFDRDKAVIKYQQALDAATDIQALAISGNPIAAAAIPTYAARMAGEVGALTEADKRPFGGTRDIKGRLTQALQEMATGKLTEENKKFVIDLTNLVSKSAKGKKSRRAREYGKRYGQVGLYGNENDVFNLLYQDMDGETMPSVSPEVDLNQFVE